MSGIGIIAAVIAFASFSVAPYLLLRTAARRKQWLRIDAMTYAVAAAAFHFAPYLGLSADAWLSAVSLAFLKIVAFWIVAVAAAKRDELRTNATALALFTLLLQVLLHLPATRIGFDGDEPYYLAITQSVVNDFDLDLRNQYARSGLGPQPGDPVGDEGELYSRHEPFLSLLMVPGYLLAGAHGAVATIFVFAFLLVRTLLLLLEDEGFRPETRVVTLGFFALGAPVLFYSMRMWPEVPAAFFFTVAVRSLRREKHRSLVLAAGALALLKLRFVAVAIVLLALATRRLTRHHGLQMAGALLVAMPFAISFVISGNPLNVHTPGELAIQSFAAYAKGFFGILLDGLSGLLFVAPLYLLGLLSLSRAETIPPSLRYGAIAALPYLILLFPRAEWHGGWSPPLRYVVVFVPLLAIAAAVAIERVIHPALTALCALHTVTFSVYHAAFPWKLFHIANGETTIGEHLSAGSGFDYSRMIPSFIRLNDAAVLASVTLLAGAVLLFTTRRWHREKQLGMHAPAVVAIALALAASLAERPGRVVHLEDSHVTHRGGELYPKYWTVARFLYIGGWRFFPGNEAAFLAREGSALLHYRSAVPARIDIDGATYDLPASPHATMWRVTIPRTGRVRLRCLAGSLIVDRIEHEQ